jgi:hypothetical protein
MSISLPLPSICSVFVIVYHSFQIEIESVVVIEHVEPLDGKILEEKIVSIQ